MTTDPILSHSEVEELVYGQASARGRAPLLATYAALRTRIAELEAAEEILLEHLADATNKAIDLSQKLKLHREGNPMTGFIEEAARAKAAEATIARLTDKVEKLREGFQRIRQIGDHFQRHHTGPGDPGSCYPCAVEVVIRETINALHRREGS